MSDISSNDNGRAVRPIEQDTVMLFGHPVWAVRLPDGRIAAAFNDMADALELQRAAQARRVREDDTLENELIPAILLEKDGSEVPGDVLTAWAIPTWLTGIQVSRLAPEKRPTISAFKREAAGVLYAHFSRRPDMLALDVTAPETGADAMNTGAVPAEPAAPASDASRVERIAYYDAMAAFLRWQQDMDEWRASADARQDAMATRVDAIQDDVQSLQGQVNEIARVIPEIVQRFGEQPLSPAHQAAIQAGVNLIHEALDMPHATIYNEVRRQFKVAKYDQIPDARWADVVAWFKPRIDLALRKSPAGTNDPFADDVPAQVRMF